ncbi:MFS transporter [Rhodococcus sp. 06-156-3C]|uniref:MFS transporter n=1 Tax=Nocardiaceae TaxID=85025 RepID=UPI000522F0D6|nr:MULTISPECIES: MFS transporter [Rhodococcus]OZD18193.1 MFS transporter [Rhodococcus sp. 06-156-4C]OZD18790.1 MFS transporter [Rhodococcus sp. 06-156-3C]OZD22300.1 MFS transporter [Rhodococcus sp. 06-156-4a]OZD34106.1 MFS transporter [Rhodococcus sp. 06-156-3b]OZD38843.1 MFS transporter [Rhodococcus sp. 06-156-3]
MSIIDDVQKSAMTRFQIVTIATCLAVMVVDGFDVIAMSFSAYYVADDWGISSSTLGYVLSASTAGMALGSLALSPLADRFGRRTVAVGGLAVAALGMLYSGVSPNIEHLVASRLITGIGVGGIMAATGIIIAEYSSRRRLGLTMALYAAANGVGGILGGLLAKEIIPAFGWHSVFLFGAAATTVFLVVAYFVLPESLDYLATRNDPRSVKRLNHIAAKMGRTVEPEVNNAGASAESSVVAKSRYSQLFSGGTGFHTVFLTLGFGTLMAAFYFMLGWTAQLVSQATGSGEVGIQVATLLPLGGLVGSIAFGLLTGIIRSRPLAVAALSLASISTFMMAYTIATGSAPIVTALVLGILLQAGITSYYGIIPQAFPAQLRTTGFGFVLGMGRVIGIVAPIGAGYLLGVWSSATVFALSGVLVGVSAIVMAAYFLFTRSTSPVGEPPTAPTSGATAEDDRVVGA